MSSAVNHNETEAKIEKCLTELDVNAANISCVRTIQGWLSPAVPVSLWFVPTLKLLAKIVSEALGRKIEFLDILMQESSVNIDEWDGKKDYPGPLDMPNLYYQPFNEWCARIASSGKKDVVDLFSKEEAKHVGTKIPTSSLATSKKKILQGRKWYKKLWLHMPQGTTKEEAHIKFMSSFGKLMQVKKVDSLLDKHCQNLFKTKFPVLWEENKAKAIIISHRVCETGYLRL